VLRYLIPITAFLGLLLNMDSAQSELRWSAKPASMNHAAMPMSGAGRQQQPGGGHNHNPRRGTSVYLQDAKGASLHMLTPTLELKELTVEDDQGQLKVPSTGMDNYHGLVAMRIEEGLHESALRYVYMRGKPSGRSPAELMANEKLLLEIVPDPLIRGHWRYMSNDEHAFIVRFNGKPLKDVWVGLATSNGSTLEATSDASGRVSFVLPDDFKRVVAGRRNNPPGEFIVRAGYSNDGTLYRTNFTHAYSTDPSHWQSTNVGVFMLIAGFVTGIVLMRKGSGTVTSNKKTAKKGSAA
jgi:hypothetical protein